MNNLSQIRNSKLLTFLENSDFKLVYHFTNELTDVILSTPPGVSKELHVHSWLAQTGLADKLKTSFSTKLIILYSETIMPELLVYLHSWVRGQCCDIENIYLITVLHMGTAEWYAKYINLQGEKGLTVIDAPWLRVKVFDRLQCAMLRPNKPLLQKKLKYYFDYWGGTYPTLERDALTLLWQSTPNGTVDYIGIGHDEILLDGYLEQVTYFKNRNLVDMLLATANKKIPFSGTANKNLIAKFNTGIQFETDSCSAICPIRETLNDVVYASLTEKTLRAFLHMQIPIPLSGVGAVDLLAEQGFRFCDLIDYNSFQYETIFFNRMCLIREEIMRIQNTYTLKQLEEYMLDNTTLFEHNYNLIQTGLLSTNSAEKVIKVLKE